MASLLSTKQISTLLKSKRKQYVESVVGLGQTVVRSKDASGASTGVGVLTRRQPVALVFMVKSLPNRAALAARKTFKEVGSLQLRKVPNGVVKAAAKNTPFELMMSGPTLIATPLAGVSYTLPQIVELARGLQKNDKINKGLLFTGLVHHNLFLTPKRLEELDFEEPKKIGSLIASPGVGILQTLNMGRIPILATLQAYNEKQAKAAAAPAAAAAGEKKADAPAA